MTDGPAAQSPLPPSPTPRESAAPSAIASQRRALILFASVSLALHLLLVAGAVVPGYVRKVRDARLVAESREQARRLAEQRRQAAAKAEADAKREAARRAEEEAKAQVTGELRQDFNAVAGEQLK